MGVVLRIAVVAARVKREEVIKDVAGMMNWTINSRMIAVLVWCNSYIIIKITFQLKSQRLKL
jgi:hypothetical protein